MQEFHRADLGRQIAQILLTQTETGSVLRGILEWVGSLFPADCCVMVVRDPQDPGLQTHIWQSPGPNAPFLPEELATLQGVNWLEILAGANLVAISDTQRAWTEVFGGEAGWGVPVRRVLGITTRFQGEINGAIIVMRGCLRVGLERKKPSDGRTRVENLQQSQGSYWTSMEMMNLTALSEQVAIAFNQVLQTQAVGSLEQQVRQKEKYQTLIHELTIAIHRGADIERILQMAIPSLAETLQADRGRILLLKYADPLFKPGVQPSNRIPASREGDSERPPDSAASRIPKAKVTVVSDSIPHAQEDLESFTPLGEGQSSGPPGDRSFWLSECYWCQQAFLAAPSSLAIADRRTLIALNPEIGTSPIFSPESMPALLTFPLVGITSAGSGPGKVLGFLVLEHSTPRQWQVEELRLVELVAAQLSTAILHRQTMQQVQALVEERTAQLQRSLDVQAKLYEKTRQQIDQLRQLNQLKDEFLTTLSHELNTPLTSMKVAIQMLRQPGITPDRQTRYLDILESEWRRESNLVRDLLKLQEYESNQATIHVQNLDLKLVLTEIANSFQDKFEEKGLNLTLDLPKRAPKALAKKFFKLNTDAESFERILHELLTNAGKYSDPGTTVYLRASHQIDLQQNQVIVTLTNTGAGISPEDLPHIFEKFRRGQGVTQQAIGGTGLGLALVKCLVQHLNGSIAVSSTPIQNSTAWETCFTLTLPQLVDNALG
ncbi:GAF domain-containing sensor histidine kinase [Laspinema olomoucense]|uniref:GAF domain-containing sensor histidine kinase n=1 Tax=Laspinema olomoucense TaxID=3231600 RepID=UPI0021BADDAF|nr:GAF domain-containing sensor histidine kinase [Laspinema sp. D3a]MCT7991398.1 GAF domain-containing sensor histidine kinase [Laspinema sp. D3a]